MPDYGDESYNPSAILPLSWTAIVPMLNGGLMLSVLA